MAEYRVTFFNNLLNPTGWPVKCMQRSLTVEANGPEEASQSAQRTFERLEKVPNWKCHAHYYEVEDACGQAVRASEHVDLVALR